MVPDFFNGTNATDQHSFDASPAAKAKLKSRWETYLTENEVKKVASWGINALRIPIGNSGTAYIKGADACLDNAISWARRHSLKVLVDCHGSPGSQNGFDNSGH
ncbi:hypothetical protein AC579_9012 [Pseudocercospora musae]|uniref:glucan 1,3-beta-glucosidase n=1 Tax=Pseudocercospora musae TaxID=113226 RepID=A0A139IT06_9PEZI|nr:hypothetical protein AC579_9012 [Pseudocercospora musae]